MSYFHKPLIIYFLISGIFLLVSYPASAQVSNEQNDNRCIATWVDGLSKNNPDMTEENIKAFARYFCSCALDQNEMVSTAKDMNDLRTMVYKKCIPYAALRNALEVGTSESDQNPKAASFADACVFTFPFDLKKIEVKNSVMLFCKCASEPLAKLKYEKEKLKEDKLNQRLYQIATDCSGGKP